ncbi:Crp/Fnr family transcriptional regulator [Pseudomonas sp. ALS1279]|jgi:CRP-like cAMP-binding protein|uniref:Crp/Fnr family transcriptional regulator n=1 Tax=Ectopseudomonas oleovorans TaxID=301 RepID=A0A427HS15_ECTOL|nr:MULTISPECIES: Crp/Fnr family transcriptional regulator [Pseudomonas]MDG9979728.1 Crp/Fnr family transcriptional regulator [Pseudomonas oleovorans]PZQ44882.1 MAG: Crp/Fnr family transcriptional regulator [Pseudomonas oleovorans]RRW37589.1 Crp/Fnr family transcriptional regulator [Pseudomonas oleovorans]TRO32284.1 Crp/Fnr family transcriptional regulator [Pseudomonas sp. ALS1279]|tara:strand:- start:489 stop:1172 length:684 start_codon:yes stop_codon:yes gene_type:complete
MPDPRHYLGQLSQGHWFAALPQALRHTLLDMAQVQRLDAGQRLFRRGDKPSGLYAVVEGAVRVGAVSETGKEALLTLVEPPYWFGEISLFDGLPRTHDAFADSASTLLLLPQAGLLALLEREPQHWRDFALLMSHKLRLAFIALEDMSLLPAAPRLARRLLLIAENYGESEPRRVLHLAQEQLALMLSLSRQTTNQILKELQAQGVVQLTYGEIEILDFAHLRRLAT